MRNTLDERTKGRHARSARAPERAQRSSSALERFEPRLPSTKVLLERRAQVTRGPRSIVVRGVVGVSSRGSEGPAYVLSPEPMTERPILNAQRRPRSVWSALLTIGIEEHARAVRAAYPDTSEREARSFLVDALLDAAIETARYTRLASGAWQVWIDAKGSVRVEVWP